MFGMIASSTEHTVIWMATASHGVLRNTGSNAATST